MYTKTQLLKAVRAAGFKGDETPEAVKAWVDAEGYELPADLDIAKCWATKAKLTLEPIVDPDDAIAPKKSRPNGTNRAAAIDAPDDVAPKRLSAASWDRISARKRYDRLTNLPDGHKNKPVWSSADEAEQFGAYHRLGIAGSQNYAEKANDLEIVGKTQVTNINAQGGALVPEAFQATLIDLKEQYGVARQLATLYTMPSDSLTFSRRTGGLTVYNPGEGAAITASDVAWDNVTLGATEMSTLTYVSGQLMNDSAFAVGDLIASEIAWAFANKEDEIYFNGDGTSTYFGFQGICPKIKGLSGTIGNIAGLFVGTGNLYSELVIGDFHGVQGLAPAYVDNRRPVWVMHKRFWATVVLPLQLAKGGVTYEEIANRKYYTLNGDPIIFSQVMPRAAANSQVCALYGAFNMGSAIGDVRGGMSIMSSEHVAFNSNRIAIRGLQRVAVNIHDVGNASATEASRVPGPIVGLITAGS